MNPLKTFVDANDDIWYIRDEYHDHSKMEQYIIGQRIRRRVDNPEQFILVNLKLGRTHRYGDNGVICKSGYRFEHTTRHEDAIAQIQAVAGEHDVYLKLEGTFTRKPTGTTQHILRYGKYDNYAVISDEDWQYLLSSRRCSPVDPLPGWRDPEEKISKYQELYGGPKSLLRPAYVAPAPMVPLLNVTLCDF